MIALYTSVNGEEWVLTIIQLLQIFKHISRLTAYPEAVCNSIFLKNSLTLKLTTSSFHSLVCLSPISFTHEMATKLHLFLVLVKLNVEY